MRSGQNPAKFIEKAGKAERVTVVVVTYIPFQAGYFAEARAVLELCLDSLRRNTPQAHDLFVFDNGSAPEVVADLVRGQAEGRIDYLFLSDRNLGKGGAWDIAFAAAPGEILAYADSDVFFHPGWLEESLAVLESFPKVGMVSGRPLRTNPELIASTLRWAEGEAEARLERGSFIPWEVFREHDLNLGQPEAEVRNRFDSTQDLRVTYRGRQAFVGAVHWQFVAWKHTLGLVLPLELNRPMGEVRELDRRLDEAGFLRLMTTAPLVRHLGNAIPDDLSPPRRSGDAPRSPPPRSGDAPQSPPPRSGESKPRASTKPTRSGVSAAGRRLLEWGPVRRVLLAVHNQIFRWYFRD